MNLVRVAFLAVAISTGHFGNALAAQAEPVTIWRDLHSGMTKKEVKAAYPNHRADVFPGCSVAMLTRFKDKRLVTVNLLFISRHECAERILADVYDRYGPGKSEEATQAEGFSGGWVGREDISWQVDGRRVTLSVIPGRITSYNLIYTVRTDGKLW